MQTKTKKKFPFIVEEGIDCSMKSTVINMLKERIQNNPEIKEKHPNLNIITKNDPSNKPGIQANIRKEVKTNKNLTKEEQLMLFMTSQLISKNQTEREIENGNLVISDRWSPSTYIYQCKNQYEEERADKLEKLIKANIEDTIYLYFKITAETSARRHNKRNKENGIEEEDVYDTNDLNIIQKRIDKYDSYFKELSKTKKVYIIDANQDAKEVVDDIEKLLIPELLK